MHGIGGIVGGILTGFFANPAVGGAAGCFYGNCAQLGPQFAVIGASAGWSAIMTAILLWAIDWTVKTHPPLLPPSLLRWLLWRRSPRVAFRGFMQDCRVVLASIAQMLSGRREKLKSFGADRTPRNGRA